MKKVIRSIFLFFIIICGVFAWLVFSNATSFNESKKYLIIEEGKTDKASVTTALQEQGIISNTTIFSLIGNGIGLWNKIKPGKFEIKKGESLLTVIKTLKNNRQAQINLVINKLRIKEDLAKLISKNFSTDSVSVMNFLNSNDSLKNYNVDTSNVFTIIIPDTYTFYWNTSLRKIFNKLYDASTNFWNKNNRTQQAASINFTPQEVYILASIVEEETNHDDDRAKIASVYINRLNKSMALQACPTIKYAMKDFSLTRIYEKYLTNPSPYNTYKRKGLPPGPICTPTSKCIDIVLHAPKTDYLFFVAKADFSGYHHFSTNFAEHSKYAKEYQKALDEYMARKQQNEQIEQ
ncbi:MAG: endolytic transglycosylase MltG [Bacteroidetes bacterium]|nr:endolytic transglycosylase MltG [Bacteroidota bacterium]MBS1650170.1 endolytic transglycosylase MltG [Bacteroidota bacterium]